MMTKITVHHSHPQLALLDIAEQVLTIANMRPSEWGYQEWGWEGEYGHRVQILDDMTRQQRTNHFVAAAGAGRVKEVEERLKHHQYIDGVHTKMHYTALHAAADFGHVEVVELLIKSGFDKFIDMVDVRYKQVRSEKQPILLLSMRGGCSLYLNLHARSEKQPILLLSMRGCCSLYLILHVRRRRRFTTPQ